MFGLWGGKGKIKRGRVLHSDATGASSGSYIAGLDLSSVEPIMAKQSVAGKRVASQYGPRVEFDMGLGKEIRLTILPEWHPHSSS